MSTTALPLQSPASLALLFLLITSLSAAEPVLMGYSRLDGSGLPKDVRVALTRSRFTELWSSAHPEKTPGVPVVELATGAPIWRIAAHLDGAANLTVELRLPVAVLTPEWRQVRLPVPSGTVSAVTVEALTAGGKPPAANSVTWQGKGDALMLSIAGHTQAVVVVQLVLPLRLDGGQWSASLPLLPGGGSLDLHAATGWEPVSPHASFLRRADGHFSADLPARSEVLELRLRRADVAAARELHLGLDQRLSVALLLDRLSWSAQLTVAVQGGTLRETRLTLPPGLVLANVESAGLAGWRQTGNTVDLTWITPVSGNVQIRASGILPRSGASGEAAVAVELAGADRSQGRLGLIGTGERNQRSERLIAGEDPALSRAESQNDEDLAVRWNDRPTRLVVRWEPLSGELRATLRAALVSDAHRVRVKAHITISGRGVADCLRLRLPPPWKQARVHVAGIPVSTSLIGSGAERLLLLRSSVPLTAGSELNLWIDADRAVLGTSFDLPDLWPVGDIGAERQTWLVGDAGDRRLRLGVAAHLNDAPATLMARDFAAELPAGATWRQAIERRSGAPAHAELVAETPRMSVTASHYLVFEAERMRWSARLVFTPEQGELTELVCQLPPGARLVRGACRDLGSLVVSDDGRLTARLTAPARSPTTLDLDLELPLSDGANVRVAAITTASGDLLVSQQVALVEDYELGLVHRSAEGLEEHRELAMPLPADVDAAQVKLRWRAQRPDWSLTLRREPLVPAGGLDGIATLVDAYSAITPDGELRSRATWHVLNRSRQQLRLSIPDSVELWEVRVDGRQTSCRRDASDAAVVWVPVRPLRSGEAARRVELTWRQASGGDVRHLRPTMPVFTELKPMQALWRFAPPTGWSVSQRDGAMRPIAATDADGERAKRVIEELTRLRGQGDLKDNALLRCNAQLDQLELELNDYLVPLNSSKSPQAIEVQGQLGQLQSDRTRNAAVYGERADNRKALGIGKRTREWAGPVQEKTDSNVVSLPGDLPWRDALAVESRTSLGDGTPPPGHRTAAERTLLGIDLVGDAPSGLTLRGSGGDLSLELELKRPVQPWWPSLAGIGAAMGLLALSLIAQRRRNPH